MTCAPSLSPDEPMRLDALRRLNMVETPLEERFERITRLAKRMLGTQVAAVSLVEASRQWFKSAQGHNVCETSRDVSFCGHTILQDDVFLIPDARKDPRFAENPLVTGPMQCVFYAGCPLKSEDGFNIGAFCVCDSQPREFTAEDVQTLRDLAALVEAELRLASASAVQASLVEDVSVEHRRSLIDGLTRMWNREGFMRLAQHCIEQAANEGAAFALVMVDLDRFKPINDTYGHAAGDEVLRACARRMLGAVRETDSIGRLGGDEFCILLPNCATQEAANAIAERVRISLTSNPIKAPTAAIPISASLGVHFVLPNERVAVDQILEWADQALYKAKKRGRDAVALAN